MGAIALTAAGFAIGTIAGGVACYAVGKVVFYRDPKFDGQSRECDAGLFLYMIPVFALIYVGAGASALWLLGLAP